MIYVSSMKIIDYTTALIISCISANVGHQSCIQSCQSQSAEGRKAATRSWDWEASNHHYNVQSAEENLLIKTSHIIHIQIDDTGRVVRISRISAAERNNVTRWGFIEDVSRLFLFWLCPIRDTRMARCCARARNYIHNGVVDFFGTYHRRRHRASARLALLGHRKSHGEEEAMMIILATIIPSLSLHVCVSCGQWPSTRTALQQWHLRMLLAAASWMKSFRAQESVDLCIGEGDGKRGREGIIGIIMWVV